MRNIRTGRALTIAVATAGALLLWAVGVPLGGHDLVVDQGGTASPIGPAAVAVATVIAGFAAWAVLALLERAGHRRLYRPVAAAVLLLSLAGPLTAATEPGTALVLVAMHLTAGAALIIGLPGLRSRDVVRRAMRTGTDR